MKKFFIIALLISLNVFSISYEKIGDWGFGRYQAIAQKGNIVYGISNQTGISVIDYSDVNNPVKLGEFTRTDKFHYMLIDGNTAFISAKGKIYICDVSNNVPETISIIELDANCFRMAKKDNYLYVAGGYAGLIVLDVSDLTKPTIVGSYFDADNMKSVVDVAVDGDNIYVVDSGKGLFILTTSDFKTYTQVGRMSGQMNRIALIGNNQIALSYGGNGVRFYNAENLASLKYLGSYSNVNSVEDFIVDGDVMYCADSYNGIVIVDISSIGSPQLIKDVVTSTVCYGIIKRNNYIFSANSSGGIGCFDVSDPANTAQISSFNDSSYPNGIAVYENKLIVADFYNGVKTLSTSNLPDVSLIDMKRGKDFPSAVCIKDNYVYYADSSTGFGVFKLNDDGTLVDVNYIEAEGNFVDIAVYQNYLLCAAEYGGLYIYDIADRENPVFLNTYYEYQSVQSVNVSENGLIVLSMGFNGVRICTISNGELNELSSINVYGFALDSVINNNYVYISDFYDGLRVVKLDDGFNVISDDLFLQDKHPESVKVINNLIYVACGDNGVIVLSNQNGEIVQKAAIPTYSNAKKIAVQGDILYIAEGLSGKIDIYRIVYDNTKIYKVPIAFDGTLFAYNNCAKQSKFDVVVYKNLKPIEFKSVSVGAKKFKNIELKNGDFLKVITDGNFDFSIKAGENKNSVSLNIEKNYTTFSTTYTLGDSFYKVITIANVSNKNGYFTVTVRDLNGKVISKKSVFIESGDSKNLSFVLTGCFKVDVRGDCLFSGTIFERGIYNSSLRYLNSYRTELY